MQPPRNWRDAALLWGLWLIILLVSVVVAFQIHATLVGLSWFVIQSPSLRPQAWSSNTITAIARFLYLVVGGGWLFGFAFVERFLAEAHRRGQLRPQVSRLLLWLAGVYAACYVLLLIVSQWG